MMRELEQRVVEIYRIKKIKKNMESWDVTGRLKKDKIRHTDRNGGRDEKDEKIRTQEQTCATVMCLKGASGAHANRLRKRL